MSSTWAATRLESPSVGQPSRFPAILSKAQSYEKLLLKHHIRMPIDVIVDSDVFDKFAQLTVKVKEK